MIERTRLGIFIILRLKQRYRDISLNESWLNSKLIKYVGLSSEILKQLGV